MDRTMNKRASLSGALLVLLALSLPAHGQIANGGFETGFAGWTRLDQLGSEGTFVIYSGTASPANAYPVPAPPEGTNAAITDADGPGSHLLYQDFVVPAGPGPFNLSFELYINNSHGATDFRAPATLDFATPTLNQQARVDIITTTADPFSVAPADVLLNLYGTAAGDPPVSGYTAVVTDVTALFALHAGQTLRLRFAEVDNLSPLNVGVDSVAITAPLPTTSSASKTVSGTFLPGSNVVYTVTLMSGGVQADNPGNEFLDVLPAQLTLVSATATSGTAVATVGTNTVTWNGAIAAAGSVTITINATVNAGVAPGTPVSNQGTFSYDSDANGTNDSSALTDDPAVGGSTDPTQFAVSAATLQVPILDHLGLALMALCLMLAAVVRLHR